MATRSAGPVKRIVVAVDSTLRSLTALDMAAALAAEFQAHLETLFIEDADLLQLAELPFATELDRTSGELRRVDPAHIASALQAQARRVQQALKTASAPHRIRSSLRVVRGHYIREATMQTGVDVLFMSTSTRLAMTRRSRASAPRVAANVRSALPVHVFCDATAPAVRALVLAAELAAWLKADLVVLRPAMEETEVQGLVERAHEAVGADRSVRFETVADAHEAIGAQVRTMGCSVLVMPRPALDTPPQEALGFAAAIDCPLVLVT